MFVGFIAVIIIILIIVVLMSTGVLSSTDNSLYVTEAKKVHTLLSHLQNESKFYYSENNESYSGITMDYFQEHDFGGNQMKTGTMSSAEWDGFPVGTDLPDPYTGAYIEIGGTPQDEMRILAASVNDGDLAVFFIVKKTDNSIPEEFTSTLEKQLAIDSSYIGG